MSRTRVFIISCLILLTTVVAGASCMHLGGDFPTTNANRIVTDTTTREDVRAWFGDPNQVGLDNGRLAWTYFYYDLKLIGEDRSKEFYAVFNADGTVHSFTFTTSFPDEQSQIRPSH